MAYSGHNCTGFIFGIECVIFFSTHEDCVVQIAAYMANFVLSAGQCLGEREGI